MEDITYIDRATKQVKKEKVYGHFFLKLLYGDSFASRLFSAAVLPCVAHLPFLSRVYGFLQKTRLSRCKVRPFIKAFGVDTSEFLDSVESYRSFNDFFTRKLKTCARAIAAGDDVAILPADGRYLVYQNIDQCDGFLVKGKKFSLERLLADRDLAASYQGGSMVIARLCPTDYHRFHFPCECLPGIPKNIPGPLFSVNPIALKRNIDFLSENKRVATRLETTLFGPVLFIEVGATNVGTIHQTFTPGYPACKGDEKGYFSFGGSCIILLFKPNAIIFDTDLVEASQQKIETLGLFGQSLGIASRE
ncbi:MAG TPA: archaetidylserine decarboxylase [Rhabdochlamydiaceae bacterium]|jgi:phosphatidylserine decarboxylase